MPLEIWWNVKPFYFLNKSIGITYLLPNIFVFFKQSCSQKFVGKLLILCIHDTFALEAIQERCCIGSQNFCLNQIDHCITHLQPFKNFNLKVLYWINLNSIVLKRSHKKKSLVENVEDKVHVKIDGSLQYRIVYLKSLRRLINSQIIQILLFKAIICKEQCIYKKIKNVYPKQCLQGRC